MNTTLDLNDMNKVTVMLMQALWGAISPNFRMVAIRLTNPVWKLLFVLEEENVVDREEIQDVIAEFDALLLDLNDNSIEFETQVIVSKGGLSPLDHRQWRLVFLRREDSGTGRFGQSEAN